MVVILSSSGVHVYGCHLVIFRGTIWLSSCHLQEYMYMVELPLTYRVLQKGNCRSSIQFHLDCLSFHFHCDEHWSISPPLMVVCDNIGILPCEPNKFENCVGPHNGYTLTVVTD